MDPINLDFGHFEATITSDAVAIGTSCGCDTTLTSEQALELFHALADHLDIIL